MPLETHLNFQRQIHPQRMTLWIWSFYIFLVMQMQCGAVARCSCYSSSHNYQPRNCCVCAWICTICKSHLWKTSSMSFEELCNLPVKPSIAPWISQLIAAYIFQGKMLLPFMWTSFLKLPLHIASYRQIQSFLSMNMERLSAIKDDF